LRSYRVLFAVCLFGLLAITRGAAADPPETTPRRPALQLINGSGETVDVFWLKSPTERVSNGSIAPGEQTSLQTTIRHRFELVGREDKFTATVVSEVPVQAYRFDPKGKDGVPSFYEQSISAHGFPIVASATVNPYALKEAAYLIDMMLAQRPDVRDAMIKSGARLCIIAYNEFTTDQPEFAHLGDEKVKGFERISGKDFWDARARGLGGSETDPFCSVGEENLLGYSGDPYHSENILIHEFAHNIHLRGMINVDPTFDGRLKETYQTAMKAGLWQGKYASTNHHEYFAEGVQSWFDNNRPPDHDHNHVNTRALLIEYDPGLAAICREVFGETVLKYTKPATRLTGHMEGYDPQKAPRFVWPERLNLAKAEIHAQAKVRSATANSDREELKNIRGWLVHVSRKLLDEERELTERALKLLDEQLEEIERVVPKTAVVELKRVPLWLSPQYPNFGPTAEYHPDVGWLRDHDRNPEMARSVEFTNVLIFDEEVRRMPSFVLHELAHAFHDRVLENGYDNAKIKHVFERAKASGSYERVERRDADGKKHLDRAYAMSNPMEYFAESTEAFFGRNDFFPFDQVELKKHDPDMFALLTELWNVPPAKGSDNMASETNNALKKFFRNYLEADFQLSPLRASRLGDHRFDGMMDDVSTTARQKRRVLTEKTLERLPVEIDYAKLSRDSQVDYEILRDSLKLDLWLDDNERSFERDPRLYTSLVTDGVYMLLTQSTLPKETAISNALNRMKQMPAVLKAGRENLKSPPRVVTETAIRQNKGAIAFYEKELFEMIGESPRREAVKAASSDVVAALTQHQAFLEQELLPKAAGDWRIGKERFANKLEMVLDAGLGADQVLAEAEADLVQVQRDMLLIARQLWSRYFPKHALPVDDDAGRRQTIQDVIQEIGLDRSTTEELTNDTRATVATLKQFIADRDILRLPDPDRCEIIEMPEFQRGNSVAFLEPAPPIDSAASSIYAISPPPKDWDPKRVASYLSEYNHPMLKILTIHEAYPGHYVQLEYANRHPSLIRKVFSSGVFAEGWANYCEKMLLDQGYGDGDLALRMMQLKFRLRAVANAILDHKMHCTEMTDEEALRFLTEDAFQSDGEARLKIIRAKQSSCQLSTYFVGRIAFEKLRRTIQKELGNQFELGRYHEVVMEQSSIPVKYLPELVGARLVK
jgi:uncharacterized protein (DUF885 family)